MLFGSIAEARVKNLILHLMIVIFAAWAFLGPLLFIIFPTNFLPDNGISHIEETENKTAQMGEVGDPPPRSSS